MQQVAYAPLLTIVLGWQKTNSQFVTKFTGKSEIDMHDAGSPTPPLMNSTRIHP